MDLLTAENLTFAYPDRDALWQNLSFTLPKSSFTLLAGAGGSGKSTLLRHLIYKLEPHGERSGHIYFDGEDLAKAAPSDRVRRIAFVMQNPDDQIVSDSVWHELAFGLENQGVPPNEMRLRIAEMANFFGMQTWFQQKTNHLSGGQKQLLNLASVLVLKPDLLVLDEPCAQLDPIAADEFAHILRRVNRELGVTIFITDHQQNLILPLADRVLLLEGVATGGAAGGSGDDRVAEGCDRGDAEGSSRGITLFSSAKDYATHLLDARSAAQENFTTSGHSTEISSETVRALQGSLPAAARISYAVSPADLTLEIREVRELLARKIAEPVVTESLQAEASATDKNANKNASSKHAPEPLVEIKNLSFTYTRNGPLVLDHLSLAVPEGQFLTILGGNGSGKSTLLHTLAGLNRPQSGHFKWRDKKRPRTALLPQNPRLLFTAETIEAELTQVWAELSSEEKAATTALFGRHADAERPSHFEPMDLLDALGLSERKDFHPSDLSGGELQRAALAVTLLRGANLLLLDEPSKGLDSLDRLRLAEILRGLVGRGITIVAVSHDLDFCAANADSCALLFQGSIAAQAEPHQFFSGHYFYTTDACRAAQGFLPGTITTEEVIDAWQNRGM